MESFKTDLLELNVDQLGQEPGADEELDIEENQLLKIQESQTTSDLLDICQKSFYHLAANANSLTGKQIIKDLTGLAHNILQKISDINESLKADGQEQAGNEVYDQVITCLTSTFGTIEGVSDFSQLRLTFASAFGLIHFFKALFGGKIQPKYSENLVKIILNVIHYLDTNQDILTKEINKVYALIKKFRDYNDQAFASLVQGQFNKKSKFGFLALIAKDTASDPKLLTYIGDQFNQLVQNDKEKQSTENLKYFILYLRNLEETFFKNQILSQIEFMLKRNGALIGVFSQTISYLENINFNKDLVLLVSQNIINDDLLTNTEYSKDCSNLFRQLGKKIKDTDSAKALVIEYLLKKFEGTKSKFNPSQRQNIIKHLNATLESLKSDLITQDQIQSILTVMLDHVFLVREEPTLKEVYDDLVKLFLKSSGYSFLNDSLKKVIAKTANSLQISIFTELLSNKKQDLNDTVVIVANQVKNMLNAENYKTTANYSHILSLVGFMCYAYQYTQDKQYLTFLIQNSNISSYLASANGFVNTPTYFQKDVSMSDVKYHLKAIELLLLHHYQESHLSQGDSTLRDTLFEYLLNQTQKFREHLFLDTLENILHSSEVANLISTNLLKSLFVKIKQVSQRPNKATREEIPHQPNVSVSQQVRLALKTILRNRTLEYSQEEFMTLLKIISHPYVSDDNRDLMEQVNSIRSIYKAQDKEDQFIHHLNLYGKELVNYSIVQRTGILSPDETLRKMSINIAVILASTNNFTQYIDHLVAVLDYKPLELITKLEGIFVQEFDRISHYDLMFYSDITRDLQKVFKDVDPTIVNKELGFSADSGSQEEEKKQEESQPVLDPKQLMAQLNKQQAAAKKTGAGAKKGGATASKTQSKPAPSKPAQTQKSAPKKEEPAQHIDKEQRNKMDRQQLLNYLNEITNIKSKQIESVFEILKRVNKNGFFLDTTLLHLLMPMVRLLSYSASRFSTTLCLQSLFSSHKTDHLFQVKNEVISCLVAISQNKIYQKHMREFQQIFQHVEANTNLDHYDRGHIELLLLMGNHVLKDMSVHLSVKEQALSVIQSFLSTDKVNDLELVRITINMMRSSYNSKNLQPYLNELLRRLKLEHLCLILQRLFEYEPVPRMALLRELVEYDLPLCCPIWLSTQIWILQFDEEGHRLAKRIWNKYGMALRNGALDIISENQNRNIYYYLRSKNTAIFEASQKATVAAIEIFQNRFDLIIDDLIEFYNKEMEIIEQEGFQRAQAAENFHSSKKQQFASSDIVADDRLNRMAVAEIIKRTAHLVQANSFKKIFEFFITKGCLDQNEAVSKACMEASLAVISSKGSDYAEDILRILERFINEKQKYNELSKNQAIIMIGSLAQYLDNTSQKKLVGTFEKMLELLNTPSELIRQSICRVIPQLARFFEDKSKKFLEDNFKILRESKDEKLLRGSAYAVAGIIKGLGLQTLQQLDILAIVHKECFGKHSDPIRKISGLYLYETLSISLGKVFEMYIEKILPDIMLCISDSKDFVRNSAISANRTIMAKLSNHAIKQVLPIFLNGLYVENWRSKLASVEALGNMAFCAPRQISFFLPRIVKGIREVLNDTHEKVHAAALQAIQNIGSVIKCPEIADILETLVKALSNPTEHLKGALKLLLDTSFVHAIDAPSLSLLVPILDSGLMMHDNESKHLASRLMGNICNLTQDPADLLPYIKILMPAIKNSLFDSIPEIRASAAKALGSLSSGLGLQNSQEMTVWLDQVLHQKNLQVSERQGAAQGFSEIVAVHGVAHFEEAIKMVNVKAVDQDPQIRESFRSTLVYLATCFDQFVRYLPQLLPIMIQGLSDDSEEVRKISLRNVKICIKQFGKQAPNQLVQPIMEMMFNKDFRVRSSSSVLMYQLVKELENDIIKSQPKYISIETKQDILSAMFVLRYDIIERVALQAAQIWKNIIDNQLKIVKQVLPVLIKQVFELIQSEYLELQEMGLNCMRGIVEKFGEKIVVETLEILESYMERATKTTQTVGISKAVYNMSYAAPVKLLTELRSRFLTMADSNLHHESDEIRKLSAQVYMTVFQKTYEPNFITSFMDKSFLKKLHHLIAVKEEKESELLIQTLKFMLKEAPDLKLEDKLIRLCKLDTHEQPLTIAQSRILAAVAPKIAQHMFKKKFYAAVLNALLQELTIDAIDDETRIGEVLKTFAEVVAAASEDEIVTINEQIIADFHMRCKDKARMGFYVEFINLYCTNAKLNYERYASQYLSNVLILMNDKDDKLVDKVIKAFNAVINGLQKENQFTHIPLIKDVIEQIAVESQTIEVREDVERQIYRKKVQTIKMLEKVEGVKTLSTVIQNSITHGSIEIRIDSAICFQYLIDFSKLDAIKTELIKICGALIRVVNDKFPPALKIQIFSALKLIMVKAQLFVKAMAPQLQTTFLKAFSDSQSISVVRKVVVECLVLFLKIAPKIDPIVKELSTMLEGDKLENESKVEVAEILAIIIRLNGKAIQQAMSTQIYNALSTIIQHKKSQFNDRTVVNCSVALAFLAAYASDPKQAQDLFEAFDNTLDVNVILGIKYGLLMNGVALPDPNTYVQKTEQMSKELLKDFSGLQEIDGKESEDAKEEEKGGRLHGAFEVLSHIGDVFIRRFGHQNAELYTAYYRAVNSMEIFKKLNSQSELSDQTFYEVLQYLSEIPVRVAAGEQDLNPELKQVISQGMDFISNFYLEFDSKRDAFPALFNMFMLNYDNFLEANDDKIQLLTKERAREVVNRDYFKSLLSDNHRSLAVELLFI